MGELAKFRVFPHGAAFSMLKGLLDDFSGHNIDAACALVETAGRFFYRWVGRRLCTGGVASKAGCSGAGRSGGGAGGTRMCSTCAANLPASSLQPPGSRPAAPLPRRLPETSTRMANFLEVMMKLRNARNLDARQSSLVDSAYFAVRAFAAATAGQQPATSAIHQQP